MYLVRGFCQRSFHGRHEEGAPKMIRNRMPKQSTPLMNLNKKHIVCSSVTYRVPLSSFLNIITLQKKKKKTLKCMYII